MVVFLPITNLEKAWTADSDVVQYQFLSEVCKYSSLDIIGFMCKYQLISQN